MNWLRYVAVVLGVCALVTFVAGFIAGFVVPVHADGVRCGAPLNVIDGSFASGVPDELKDACQSAANTWIGYALIPCFAFFIPAFALALVLQRRGEFWARRIR